ncbi:MAG: hypothetical protein EOO14_21505 [Chitinophagaceae bacterium]|nr:MAG: hypothetical protein EOO14_21505 [Chitinophagaceae bacterium]
MKFIAVPILILLLATQAFSKWVMLLEFSWNQEMIAKNLCENRQKPKMKCGGKCQLMKAMAQQEENTSSPSKPIKLNFQELQFASASDEQLPVCFTAQVSIKASPYLFRKYIEPSFPVFHPPA